MAEYIDRESAYKTIMGEPPDAHYPQWYADKILSIPVTDVAPVRHGRWDDYGSGVCCTNCGVSLFHQDENNNFGIEPSAFRYCPYCGAIMEDAE